MGLLNQLKTFLADRPEYAFLAICLLVIAHLFRLLMKSKADHLQLAMSIAPLANRMADMLQMAASRSRGRKQAPETSGTDSDNKPVSGG